VTVADFGLAAFGPETAITAVRRWLHPQPLTTHNLLDRHGFYVDFLRFEQHRRERSVELNP